MFHLDGVDYAKVEANYRRWWEINGADKPLHVRLPAGTPVVWPLHQANAEGRSVEEPVGGFCHCEFESEQIEMWGFTRPADRARFVQLYGGDIL